ncbi:MAG: ferrous iron transport protein A [Sarcina sp.]|nr:ferrous iron transport protein A [Sarcina sp.]
MKLTETRPDQNGQIRKIDGDAHFLNRITAIGVTEGTQFQTIRNDKKMPVLLYLRETLIAVNREDAQKIEVETI